MPSRLRPDAFICRVAAIAALALFSFVLGCPGSSPEPVPPTTPSPQFVAFRQASMVIDRLETPLQPPYAVGSTPLGSLLTSSDPSVVEIDPLGDLVGRRNGEATIRGSSGAVLKVIVQAARTLRVVPQHIELALGQKRDVQVLGDGDRLLLRGLRWQTSSPDIAAAFGSTVQAGLTPGTATLTALSGDARATLEVVVRPVTGVALKVEPSRLTLSIGSVQRLKVTEAHAPAVNWTSSNAAVVQPLRDGLFLAKSIGTARACAVHGEGKACATVKVVY